MKLIIGLGNPGEKYRNNRHNVGYMVIDKLQQLKLPSDPKVVKPDVFMNDSGIFVKKLTGNLGMKEYSNLYIVHDDLDIPIGSYKIQFGRGPKDHNGIESIDNELGTNEYWRVRVGIENRNPDNRISGEIYTLQDFTDEEIKVLDRIFDEICKKLVTL